MDGGRRTNGLKANSQEAGARAAGEKMAKPLNLEMNTTTTRKVGRPSGLDSLASLVVNLALVKDKMVKVAKVKEVEAVADVADVATDLTEEVEVDLLDQDLERTDQSLLSQKLPTKRMLKRRNKRKRTKSSSLVCR